MMASPRRGRRRPLRVPEAAGGPPTRVRSNGGFAVDIFLRRGVLDLGEPVEPLSEHVGARLEKKPVAVRLNDTAHHGKQ